MAYENKQLDETGWRILEALQENARMSFQELGKRVNLTPPAVAERVRRMEEAGIIRGYRVELAPEKLGLTVTAFIRIRTDDTRQMVEQIEALLPTLPEVRECYTILGDDCYHAKVMTTSLAHLDQLLARLRKIGAAVTTTVTLTEIVPPQPICQPITQF